MSTKERRMSSLYVAVYLGACVALWMFAFSEEQDKSRAMWISAAGAISAGGAGVLGSLFSSRLTSRLQQKREDTRERQQAYARLVGALLGYSRAWNGLLSRKHVVDSDNSPAELKREAMSQVLIFRERTEERRAVLDEAFSAVDLMDLSSSMTGSIKTIRSRLKELVDNDHPIPEGLSDNFSDCARKERGGVG